MSDYETVKATLTHLDNVCSCSSRMKFHALNCPMHPGEPNALAALDRLQGELEEANKQAQLAHRAMNNQDDTLMETRELLNDAAAENTRLRAAGQRLLDEASEVGREYDDEDLTEACRIFRQALAAHTDTQETAPSRETE